MKLLPIANLLLLTIALLLSTSRGMAMLATNKTAIVFGATGAVGNEVLRAVVEEQSFTKVIVVGRREFPAKVTDLLPDSAVKIIHKDLGTIDQQQQQQHGNDEDDEQQPWIKLSADACFIAAGSGFPHLSDMHDWHYAEVVVARSIAKVCGKMNTRVLSVFTAIDSDDVAKDFQPQELVKTDTPMGWWPVLTETIRMMRLKEKAVISASAGIIPFIRIFRPSNIITKETRYGWLDWALFKFHGVFDEWLPTEYHSVTTEFLAQAMVKDAVNVLSGNTDTFDVDEAGAVRLDYGDFLTILGKGEPKNAEL